MTYPVDSGSCLGVLTIAAIRLPGRDVGEALVAARVQPRIQEAEGGFAGAEARVVEEGDDGGGDLFVVSESVTTIELMWGRTGEAAEVPPLGVRTPP